MTLLQSVGVLLTFAAIVSFINHKFLRFPPAIGMVAVSTVFAMLLLLFNGSFHGALLSGIIPEIKKFDFHGFLLHGILAYLLFAGATKVDIAGLKKWAGPIGSLASFGVVCSAFTTGTILWFVSGFLGFELPFIWACLFGALISPTDPIAALGIVKSINAPKHLEKKLVGESLFNDGTGVVLFLTILAIIQGQDLSTVDVALMLTRELVGAVLLGLLLGYVVYLALKEVDHYPVVILLTFALATGSYALAEAVHVSAPVCTVVCGLFIGHVIKENLSAMTHNHVDQFWEFLDETLNACLFALMGLELLVLEFSWMNVLLGGVAFLATILGRFVGVAVPLAPFGRRISKGTIPVLTWGGLRGGISLALALSLPPSELSGLLATLAFITVILSTLGQGLTLKYVVQHYHKPKVAAERVSEVVAEKE